MKTTLRELKEMKFRYIRVLSPSLSYSAKMVIYKKLKELQSDCEFNDGKIYHNKKWSEFEAGYINGLSIALIHADYGKYSY